MYDISDLEHYYTTPLGQHQARMTAQRLLPLLPKHFGGDMACFGYVVPMLPALSPYAALQKAPIVLPHTQGACGYAGRTGLVDATLLPIASNSVGLAIGMHWLEYVPAPHAIREMARILTPSGTLILVVSNRLSRWTGQENTPSGCGAAFLRRRLKNLLRQAGLAVTDTTGAGFTPPLPEALFYKVAPWCERWGSLLWSRCAQSHIIVARKQVFTAAAPLLRKKSLRYTLRPQVS